MSEEVGRRTSQADAQIERHGPEGQEVGSLGCRLQGPKPWPTTLKS